MKISFHFHVNENVISDEWMSTRNRFEKEAKGNMEMAYYIYVLSEYNNNAINIAHIKKNYYLYHCGSELTSTLYVMQDSNCFFWKYFHYYRFTDIQNPSRKNRRMLQDSSYLPRRMVKLSSRRNSCSELENSSGPDGLRYLQG